MRIRCLICRTRQKERFEFETDKQVCPQCGCQNTMHVHELTDVHFLQPDPSGPIVGEMGRYRVACQPKRDALGTQAFREDGEWDHFSATHEAPAVTCRSCVTTPYYQQIAAAFPVVANVVRTQMGIRGADGCC